MLQLEQAPKYGGRYRTPEVAAALCPVEAKPQMGSAPSYSDSDIALPVLAGCCYLSGSVGISDEALLL
jgi:hypothetical protein